MSQTGASFEFIFDKVEETNQYYRLWIFLKKLDVVKDETDPWYQIKMAQRMLSKP